MSTEQNGTGALPLDGNAAAGILRELFVCDVTTASAICGGCRAASRLGEAKMYGGPMGAVLRCIHCEAVVVRLVRTPAGYWLDMQGARSLFVPGSQP